MKHLRLFFVPLAGVTVVLIGHDAPTWLLWISALANGLVWYLGELLSQSSMELAEHAKELCNALGDDAERRP